MKRHQLASQPSDDASSMSTVRTIPPLRRYYVRAVKKPKDRASIALAVRVGSVVEEEHERGTAHIVEHL